MTTNEKRPLITTTVLYPNGVDAHLNIEYYVKQHLPLAERIWAPLGMRTWAVTSFMPGPDGSPPPYLVETVSEWTSVEAAKEAMECEAGKKVLQDVPNFTNVKPVAVFGEVIGRWSRNNTS
ncbi:hypothetical protein BJX64DRAFT_285193 [Aspergillus heterothallicus]